MRKCKIGCNRTWTELMISSPAQLETSLSILFSTDSFLQALSKHFFHFFLYYLASPETLKHVPSPPSLLLKLFISLYNQPKKMSFPLQQNNQPASLTEYTHLEYSSTSVILSLLLQTTKVILQQLTTRRHLAL